MITLTKGINKAYNNPQEITTVQQNLKISKKVSGAVHFTAAVG